jgi:hypothetical protein
MIRRSVVVLAVSILATTTVLAADGSGVKAAVDSKGNLRPLTAAEQKALEPAQPRSFMKLQPKIHANGMVSIQLDESMDHAFVVRTDEEGTLGFACTDDHSEASAFVASSASLDTIMRIKPVDGRVSPKADRE